MDRSDVSFTFLDRIREIEENIEDGRFQSALALAVTLPDICGGIAFPELVKRGRDGRIPRDRSGEPSRDTGRQYSQWVDTYGAPFLKKDPADEAPYICGERLWQLRCEYLHQNKGFDNDTPDTEVRFHLGLNCGSSSGRIFRDPDPGSSALQGKAERKTAHGAEEGAGGLSLIHISQPTRPG